MNSMICRSRVFAVALCLGALAGCNAVEDVRTTPATALPVAKAVLQGSVSGLGSRRSITVRNKAGKYAGDTASVTAAVPTAPTTGAIVASHFTFGALDAYDASGAPVPYDIEVSQQPYGKTCTVVSGGTGLLNAATLPDVVISCSPAAGINLYNVTVNLNASFASSQGAKVFLRTEEAIFQCNVSGPNDPSLCTVGSGTVTFVKKLMNTSGLVANGPIPTPNPGAFSPVFEWTVNAGNTVGNTENRCPVTNPANPTVSGNLQNPSADIAGASAPSVGACSFTISGTVYYSRPAGVTVDSALGAGLTLAVRNMSGVLKGTATIPTGAFPTNFSVINSADSTTAFTSNPDADFQVVVATQPAGQTCIVPDGGYISLRSLVLLNPTSITGTGVLTTGLTPAAGVAATTNVPVVGTRLVVICRDRPAVANALVGVYRLTKTTAYTINNLGVISNPNDIVTGGGVTQPAVPRGIVPWVPYDLSRQNTASNNIIAFFDDGTFLYGTHASTQQLEHGFYDYSATLPATTLLGAPAGRLRFTLITDPFFRTTFPSGFNAAEIDNFFGTGSVVTAGLSDLPGALTFGTAPNAPLPFRHVNLGNVVKTAAVGTTPSKITGTAGPYGGSATNFSTGTFTFIGPIPAPLPATTAATISRQVDMEFTDVQSLNGQMTGGWTTQDHRRLWVWDKDNSYGYHVGVNGFSNLQSSCFTIEIPTASSGTFQRRGSSTGCYAINRPREAFMPGATVAEIYFFTGAESVDNMYLTVTHTSSATAAAPAAAGGNVATGNAVPGVYGLTQIRDRFPNYEARIPGGESAIDGRSPSPVYYSVAPAASFFSTADPAYFPPSSVPFTSWCTTEILGIRKTLNGTPFQEPVYMCRTKPN